MSASPGFVAPDTLEEAAGLFASHGDEARIIAGGQSLVPLMTIGLAAPELLVSLQRCDGLGLLTVDDRGVGIGATVSTRRLEQNPHVIEDLPLLAAAAGRVGSPHVRNMGTVVGNLCHADPGGDLIPALLCHDSRLRVATGSGERWVLLGDLVTGPFTTVLADDEIAVEVRVTPEEAFGHHAYRKVVKRSGDLALASCAALLSVEGGRIAQARLSVGGAVAAPIRLDSTEAALVGAGIGDVSLGLLRDTVGADMADGLLPEKSAPRDYLAAMFPRLVTATVSDALGATS